MAAVDKGIAAVFVAGLRSHGFQSIVAPGPSDKQYRVLIGPLPNAAKYTQAKDKLDQLGLTTFGRRYQQ
jgi:cell division septation protein DedD